MPYNILGLEPYPKKKPDRDSRRSFIQTQKNEIWDRQKGKCANTKCKKSLLRSATHYDHKTPWEKGGKTEVKNGQALCPNCHALKTNKDRLKKVDKKRKTKSDEDLFSSFKPVKIRPIKFNPPKINLF